MELNKVYAVRNLYGKMLLKLRMIVKTFSPLPPLVTVEQQPKLRERGNQESI